MAYYGRGGNYYVAGDNYGRAGNYAYQAGGLFSSIGRVVGSVARVASNFLPGPLGTVARIGGGLLAGAAAGRAATAALPALMPPPPQGTPVPVPGVTGFLQRLVPGGETGYMAAPGTKRRKINPMNVKALRRATRRIDGFARTARKALKHSPFMLVSRNSRGRRGSPGVITRSEAARALKR